MAVTDTSPMTQLDRWLSVPGRGRHVRVERPGRDYLVTAYEQAPMLRPVLWAYGRTQASALEALSRRLTDTELRCAL